MSVAKYKIEGAGTTVHATDIDAAHLKARQLARQHEGEYIEITDMKTGVRLLKIVFGCRDCPD